MKKMISDKKEVCAKHDAYTLMEMHGLLNKVVIELPEDQRSSARFEIDSELYPYDDNEYPKMFLTW
jgi:hypothetical protein